MKILIAGYGSIGKRHHSILLKLLPNASFTLCDTRDGFVKLNEVEDILYDLAVICVPTSEHIKISRRIKTKSYFIEKPLDSDFKAIKKNLSFFQNSE